jgi:ArsR family transcriptional regulator
MQILEKIMENIVKVIKALSDETRIRIMNLLLKANLELCVCEIEELLGIPQYNISKHIKELKNALLVKERKEGRFVYCSLAENDKAFFKNINNLILSIPEEHFKKDNEILSKKISELLKSGINEKRCKV